MLILPTTTTRDWSPDLDRGTPGGRMPLSVTLAWTGRMNHSTLWPVTIKTPREAALAWCRSPSPAEQPLTLSAVKIIACFVKQLYLHTMKLFQYSIRKVWENHTEWALLKKKSSLFHVERNGGSVTFKSSSPIRHYGDITWGCCCLNVSGLTDFMFCWKLCLQETALESVKRCVDIICCVTHINHLKVLVNIAIFILGNHLRTNVVVFRNQLMLCSHL